MPTILDLFFSANAGWFTVAAVIGTAVFALRLVMLLLGLAGEGGDLHADLHVGSASGGDHHGDPGEAFKVLSIQSIAAMLMGFGWAGLGALKGADLSLFSSLLVAAAGGAGMVWLLATLLGAVKTLEASGNIPIHAAVGVEGDVYITVPPKGQGSGQVRLVVRDRQRILNAVSDELALVTQTRVRVVGVNEDNTVIVRAAGQPA